jgi:hypothetical protein
MLKDMKISSPIIKGLWVSINKPFLMNDPAASCRVSGLAYSNNLSCLREVLGRPCFWT